MGKRKDEPVDDFSRPHECEVVPEVERVKSGISPGKRVIWFACLGRDHFDHPDKYGLVGTDGEDMYRRVAAHARIDLDVLMRQIAENDQEIQAGRARFGLPPSESIATDQKAMDTLLLQTILALHIGTIANVVQAAVEQEGSLYERLAKGYYELTNKDPGAETDGIGLKD